MAIDLEALRVKLLLDSSDFQSGLKGAQNQTGGFKKAMGSVLSTAGGFLAANVIAKGFGAIKDNIGATVDAASDWNESLGKSSQVFGAQSDAMVGWAKSGAAAFGLNQRAALETASTFGNLFTGMGVGGAAAAGMSQDVVELAADLSSFNNIPIDQVLDDIQSGLVGEAEPLRKYGILLNEATVSQKAMEMSGKANAKQLTEQDKVLARNELIWEQTTKAQGDFTRTSKGLANQQRILAARLDNLRVTIGAKLLPTFLKITDAANRFLARMDKLTARGVPPLNAIMRSLHTTLDQTFGKGTGDKIYHTLQAIGNGIRLVYEGIRIAIPIIIQIGQAFADFFRFLDRIGILDAIANEFRALFAVIKDVVDLFRDVVNGDWAKAWDDVKRLAGDALDLLLARLATLGTILKALFDLALQAIRNVDWGGVVAFLAAQGLALLSGLYDAARGFLTGTVLPWLGGLPGELLAAVPDLVGTLVGKGWDVLTGLLSGITAAWGFVSDWLGGIGSRVLGAVGSAIGWLWSEGWNALQGLFTGASAAWDALVAPWLGDTATRVLAAVGHAIGWLWSEGWNVIQGLWTGVTAAWDALIGPFFSAVGTAIDALIPDNLQQIVTDALHGIVAALQGIYDGIKPIWDNISGVIDSIVSGWNKVKGIFGGGGGEGAPTPPNTTQDQNAGGQGGAVGTALPSTTAMPTPTFDGSAALAAIQTWVANVLNEFVGLRNGVQTLTASIASVVQTNLQTAATNGAVAILDLAVSTKNSFSTINDNAQAYVGSARTVVILELQTAATEGAVAVLDLRNSTKNSFSAINDNAQAYVGSARTAIILQLQTAATAGAVAILDLRNSTKNSFQEIASTASSTMNSVRNSIANALQSAANAGVSAMYGMASGIRSAIGSIGDAGAFGVGSAIGAGIAAGIGSWAGAIAATAAAVVAGAIAAANAAARTSSPSKETAWTGRMIAAGLAQGMIRGEPDVRAASRNLANAATAMEGAAGSANGRAGGFAGRGGIVNYGTIGIEDPDPMRIRDAMHATMVGMARS